jgi:prevent-host-death family protein
MYMTQIRPVSDLRYSFADISRIVHESGEPVILTKNGYGDMVVISYEAYERRQFESEVYIKLKETEMQAQASDKRFSHIEMIDGLRKMLRRRQSRTMNKIIWLPLAW